jgi:glucose/arabinose dehydrogenase
LSTSRISRRRLLRPPRPSRRRTASACRSTWHPATREIWATEHGNSGNDEINVVRSGVNYGWPTIGGGETLPNMEAPLTSFTPSIAPFYQGARSPA